MLCKLNNSYLYYIKPYAGGSTWFDGRLKDFYFIPYAWFYLKVDYSVLFSYIIFRTFQIFKILWIYNRFFPFHNKSDIKYSILNHYDYLLMNYFIIQILLNYYIYVSI